MPCVHEFGVIDEFDEKKDYIDYEPERYGCAAIDDDAFTAWWGRLEGMKTYFHCYSRPSFALAHCGVTLIPPESLTLFRDILLNDTEEEFSEQAEAIIKIAEYARDNGKYMIHFGI